MIKKRSGLIIEYANEERKYVKSTERKKEIMFPKKNHPNQPTTPIPTRRSIRKYKPNPVPKHIIDRIIEAAGAAPSAKNRQPWQYRVYTGNAKKNLLEVMKKGLLREEKEPQLPLSAAGMLDAYNTLHIMENAPVIIMVVNTNGRSPFAVLNADERFTQINDTLSIGASIQNMLLRAEELGLGSLWIGNTCFAYRELTEYMQIDTELIGAVALGYKAENPSARPRKNLKEIVQYISD